MIVIADLLSQRGFRRNVLPAYFMPATQPCWFRDLDVKGLFLPLSMTASVPQEFFNSGVAPEK